VFSSVIAPLSSFFAPRKGIAPNRYTQYRKPRMIAEEYPLKRFHHLGERSSQRLGLRGIGALADGHDLSAPTGQAALQRLAAKKLVVSEDRQCRLTELGRQKAARVVRLHRLWELYLTKYMNIAADHVHDDAETIEHIITPELERELEHQLGYPNKDPHD